MGVERLKRMQKPLPRSFSFLLIIRRNAIVGPERQWLLSQLDSMIRRLNVIAALGEFRRGLNAGPQTKKAAGFSLRRG